MKRILILTLLSCALFQNCAQKTRIAQNVPEEVIEGRRAEVLFLGNVSAHHNSSKFAPLLITPLFNRGINITYTSDTSDLNTDNLKKYDGLIIYGNYDTITPDKEQALKEFVEGGKGLIPIHSASACFVNSDWYIQTVGGRFKSHRSGVFSPVTVKSDHPVMEGIAPFSSWDETYVHSNLNPDMTILQERVEGDVREPWTWVREQGKGRVFYTASGHNDSTWKQPEFIKLIGNGVLWAVGDKVNKAVQNYNIPKGVYSDANVPNYENRNPAPLFQHAFTAEESKKLIQVPTDFDIELFAAEPDITNPIAMAWDEKGRLWVIETVDYPNEVRQQDGTGGDRIKICEDTDGDGKADKFTVFADNLNIPTSITFMNGGVLIAQAPHFVFLKDTNGDDKADIRENIISGWGQSDTHAGPSNLKYGFDNRIWGVVGYAGYDGKIGDKTHKFGQGVYSFSTDAKDLDFKARTSNNTWGLGFTEDNDIFISTANNTHTALLTMPSKFMAKTLPSTNFQPVQKLDGHYDIHVVFPNLRQVDVMGGFTAASGHNFYTARNFPKSYWNTTAFVAEPTGRLIHNAILEKKGSGFVEKDGWNLLASSDEWVAPVHVEVGPDGAVWVADWYDFIIQHNPTPRGYENGKGNAYINPLRDRERGRIYKIKYKNAKPYTPIILSVNDTEGLLAALQNDNYFWRITAQRLLVESKNKAVAPALYQIINKKQVDEIGVDGGAIHAIWTLHGLGLINESNAEAIDVITKALNHPAAGVRKAAIQVLPKTLSSVGAIQKSEILKDKDLRVRLAAILAIAEMPATHHLGHLIYDAANDSENAKDQYIPQALLAAANAQKEGYLATAKSNTNASELIQNISKAVNEEIYRLDRRNPLLSVPEIVGKEIYIKGTVGKRNRDLEGNIVAQGDKNNGYAVYIQDAKLHMTVIQNGKKYTASSTSKVSEKFDFIATLTQKGNISLEIDEKQVAKAKAPGLFTVQPTQTVRVGEDLNNENRIGNYQGNFFLTGVLENAELELKKASVTATAAKPVAETSAASTLPTAVVNMKVLEHVMKFDKSTFTVKAGQKVVLNLSNPDFMQHNLLIIKPGTLDKVGNAADVLARDPNGADKQYVPKMPEVLFATKLLNPEDKVTLRFTAPSTPGDYPFVCTFPGHWRIMNGVMKVVK
jgi:putative membrane-bound dehydrogenase-like protein